MTVSTGKIVLGARRHGRRSRSRRRRERRRYRPRALSRHVLPAVRRRGAPEAAGRQAQGPRAGARDRAVGRCGAGRGQAVLRAAPPPQVEHVAGRRGGGPGPRRHGRVGRQHRRAAGHLDVRHAHARGRAPAGAGVVPADGARRDRDARSRRQSRMRRRQSRASSPSWAASSPRSCSASTSRKSAC